MVLRRVGRFGLLIVGLVVSGCQGETIVTDTVQQSGVTIMARPAADAAPLAAALGWPAGQVPGATVIIDKVTSDSTPPSWADTLVTDSTGRVTISALEPGHYRIWVWRQLSEAEKTRAASSLGDTYGFGGLATLEATSGSQQASVALHSLGRGSLVFSEIYPAQPLLPHENYYDGQYLEVFNNADTSIDLAGKLFLEAMPGWYDYPTSGCHSWDEIIDDPGGLWSRLIYRFPDGSRILQPGDAVVIAVDAIDHTQVGTGPMFYDLSRADFEFRGSSDVDNPLALDMINVGPYEPPLGHGWVAAQSRTVIALAMPLDIASLAQVKDSIWGTLVRVPTSAVLDVVQFKYDMKQDYAECPPSVDPGIDAGEAMVLGNVFLDARSMHRRVGGVLSSGRVFLQKSHDSAIDFEAAPGNPGTVP